MQPLNLGGYHYSGGGLGGPPGGFIGFLPQTRVAYDVTEAAASGIADPISYSGASLLDNLNHIRYRLGIVESGFGGVTVLEDNVVVSPGITVLNFENADIEYVAPDRVNITITTELNDKFMPSGIYGDNLSNQIGPSGGSHFYINYPPVFDDSLRVYSYDIDLNSDIISILKKKYSVSGCQTIVVNGNKSIGNIENSQDFEKSLFG